MQSVLIQRAKTGLLRLCPVSMGPFYCGVEWSGYDHVFSAPQEGSVGNSLMVYTILTKKQKSERNPILPSGQGSLRVPCVLLALAEGLEWSTLESLRFGLYWSRGDVQMTQVEACI